MSLERGRNTGRQIGIHVPQATEYCQVVSSGNDEDGIEQRRKLKMRRHNPKEADIKKE
ncbi:hypothetical protein AB205_0125320 [Aquarana catesbeiana]|uniref:Uncharacterized protein n=1 Tax=Aquarana catesbeiana TaxID=8400 RepID=A0A2G9RWS0_AQUCT|nr:hypothetical protein AB205_0125320 [Aquarana catesbeiana]